MGLDPVYDRLPPPLRQASSPHDAREAAEAIYQFCSQVLEVVAPLVPAVKIQSACFERYLWPGVKAYHCLISHAKSLGLIVIADAKRGDIGASSEHYAAGCLADRDYDPPFGASDLASPDALTVNSYIGIDALESFLKVAAAQGKGLFVLVRTSNPGSDVIQSLQLSDGRSVADAVAELVSGVGSRPEYIGQSGFSLLGAVVGATKPTDAARLRQLMPKQILLVPGFGVQGGSADDVRCCFNEDGVGALITASRSILYAYESTPDEDWRQSFEQATLQMKNQISTSPTAT